MYSHRARGKWGRDGRLSRLISNKTASIRKNVSIVPIHRSGNILVNVQRTLPAAGPTALAFRGHDERNPSLGGVATAWPERAPGPGRAAGAKNLLARIKRKLNNPIGRGRRSRRMKPCQDGASRAQTFLVDGRHVAGVIYKTEAEGLEEFPAEFAFLTRF